jgi:hypothetical protein
MNLFPPFREPGSSEIASPAEALHQNFLLHRSALLSIHHAEVSFALHQPPETSMKSLNSAASSSEMVALSLSGLPTIHPDAPSSQIPHPPVSDAPLAAPYARSKSMAIPATNLLREARRSAAEAWNLIGVLKESQARSLIQPKSIKKSWFSRKAIDDASKTSGIGLLEESLDCYERALGWAAVGRDRPGGIGEPGESTTEKDWQMLWANSRRVRDELKAIRTATTG